MKKLILLLCAASAFLHVQAEGKGPLGILKTVGTFLDSMAVKGLDRRYIDAPKKPWQVILRGNINQSDLKDMMQEYLEKEGWERADQMVTEMPETDYRIRSADKNAEESQNSSIRLNFDARLSVTYEWNERIFVNAYGQFSNFNYKTDYINGRLNDWYINAAIGIRL